ncbi:Toll/interleukin-1 receptor domain-containing protein [Tanacetum coccineum]
MITKIRLVRCPGCKNVLPEPPEVQYYECGGCGAMILPDSVKTDSIGKMNNLKLLQLNQLELTGSYENILKDLRWLCWRQSHLKTIPQKLHMEKLVVIDMSRSKLKVLPLLKILNLTDSDDLVEIQNISRLPNLEFLVLVHCRKLVRISDTLGDLTGLISLDTTGCENLRMRKQPKSYERIKVSLFGGQKTKQSHFHLPNSLKQLLLKDCNLKDTHYIPLTLENQSQLEYLNLAVNPFELLPSYTHLNNLRVLDLSGCRELKRLFVLPTNLPNEDFFKFVPVAMLTEADLGHMNWLRAYQDLEMLYEFNIVSISLPDIEKPNIIPEYEYTSDDPLLSFKVPERSCNRILKGLNITFKYTIQGDEWVWFVKLRTNKGVDLIYNPKAFGKPAADRVGIWGVVQATDEEDETEFFGDSNKSMVDVNESFEDNDESFEEKNAHADILGADISGFKLCNGTCYLCRHDYSQLMEVGRLNPNWFRNLVGDTTDYTEIGGWRKTGRPYKPYQSFTELKNVRCSIYGPQLNEFYTIEELTKSSFVDKAVEFTSEFTDKTIKDIIESMESTSSSLTEFTEYSGPLVRKSALKEIVLKVELSGDKEKQKAMQAACNIKGIDSVMVNMKEGKLTVTGHVDFVTVLTRLRKLGATEIISVGPVDPQKEDRRTLLSNFMARSDSSGPFGLEWPAWSGMIRLGLSGSLGLCVGAEGAISQSGIYADNL